MRRWRRLCLVGLALPLALVTGCHATFVPGAQASPVGAPGSGLAPGGPQPPAGLIDPSADNHITLEANARSVQVTAPIQVVSSIILQGNPQLSVRGDVRAGGQDLGAGTLTARGPRVQVTGSNLQLAGTRRITPESVTVNGASIVWPQSGSPASQQPFSVSADQLSFSASSGASGASSSAGAALNGPVTVSPQGYAAAEVSGSDLRWVDAPGDFTVSGEGNLSWAGPGSITASEGPLTGSYLGVHAEGLSVQVHQGPQVMVRGTGMALQEYVDGVPQLRVPARMDVLASHATTGGIFAQNNAFVWTPRNLSLIYDMDILSIRPANAAARRVRLGLLALPPMFGGEPHDLLGSDTAGLKPGASIDSVIAHNGDDKRGPSASTDHRAPPWCWWSPATSTR